MTYVCYNFCERRSRSLLKSWVPIANLNFRRAFGILSWLPNDQNSTKLFLIGGLDTKTNKPIRAVEMYNEENNTWEIYKDLPNYDFKFPESPDYGCLSVFENVIYSVVLSENAFIKNPKRVLS